MNVLVWDCEVGVLLCIEFWVVCLWNVDFCGVIVRVWYKGMFMGLGEIDIVVLRIDFLDFVRWFWFLNWYLWCSLVELRLFFLFWYLWIYDWEYVVLGLGDLLLGFGYRIVCVLFYVIVGF